MYYDEYGESSILKQVKRMWVAVLNFRASHRPSTPTVKPFLRSYKDDYLGGLLSGVF